MKRGSISQLATKRRAWARGQAMAEFAMGAIVAVLILFLSIQLAIIGRDAMALGQFSYQAARWASEAPNTGSDCNALVNYLTSKNKTTNASNSFAPAAIQALINSGGINCGGTSAVSVTMLCTNAGVSGGNCTQRSTGDQVQVEMTANITPDLFFGQSFLGVVSFPTSLSTETTALTQ